MQRTVQISPNQKVTAADFGNFGAFPRQSFDIQNRDLAGFPAPRYAGFQVEQSGVSEVRVGAGRLYKPDGSVYGFETETGAVIDLLDHLPAVAKRIASIVVFGNLADTEVEPRTFLVDASTGQTEGREVATESRRIANVDKLLGQEAATPEAPAIASDLVAVAEVVLTPAGIESITQLVSTRVASLRSLEETTAGHSDRFAQVGPQLDTLSSDLSNVAVEVDGKAEAQFVGEVAVDVARLKETVGLPDDYSSYGVDHFLTAAESDLGFGGANALVEEGLRFPRAAAASVPLELDNPLESRVSVEAGMALPVYDLVRRLSVRGAGGEYPLSSTTVETTTLRTLYATRTRRVYHSAERVSTSAKFWQSGRFDPISGVFRRGGETFEVETIRTKRHSYSRVVRLRRFTLEEYLEPYWDRVTTSETVSGSIVAQTFLNSQDGWLGRINLFFSKVAASGPVRVAICRTNNAGEPRLDQVLSKTTVEPAALAARGATAVKIQPTYLEKGKRYALVLISSGAHFVRTVSGNKFAQGTLFYSTDGAYAQGELQTDLQFELEFARFRAPIVTVSLGAVELAGGIDKLDINADSIAPSGTRVEFQVRVGGAWITVDEESAGLFASRPSLVQLRARFLGTTDVMPSLGLGATRSAISVSRPATAFEHVSTVRSLPGPVSEVSVSFRLEAWSPDLHGASIALLTGAGHGTVVSPDAVVDAPDRDDPDAIVRTATFVLGSPVSDYRIRLTGSTSSDLACFHAAERTDLGFA